MAICSWPLCFWDIDVNTSHLNSLDPTRGVLWAIIFARLGFRYFILHTLEIWIVQAYKKGQVWASRETGHKPCVKKLPRDIFEIYENEFDFQQKHHYRKMLSIIFFLDSDKPAAFESTATRIINWARPAPRDFFSNM